MFAGTLAGARYFGKMIFNLLDSISKIDIKMTDIT
ncbi:Putative protein [Zobellia galactanivorans]|uniref:Uncharacterized protein n=1 Tax=Zobellia galactanivorans (strain DSM 12802 / CCUG 47099 / CIP 106680 / NCIMB 13871 / Dsij) TaxID=63186 RepID=G0L8E8_ZOBGA|nr:Putative protein [Zobellia galactanivorans]